MAMTTMEGAIRSAILSLTQTGAADVAASARKTAITALLAIIGAVLATASIGCFVAALWIYAAPLIGAAAAMLTAAAVLLILCLAVVLLVSVAARTVRRPRPPAISPEVLLAEATRLLKDQKGTMLVAALVAGMLVGNDSRKQ